MLAEQEPATGQYRDSAEAIARSMIADPVAHFAASYERMHAIERDDLEAIQLSALKLRFSTLRDRVQMLNALADEAAVSRIEALDDVTPILFRHTVYKSYPVSLLENNRFKQITQWLQRLTTVDLSHVNVSGCQSIDDWVKALDETEFCLRCSSGTSGTMSFLPRTFAENETYQLSSSIGVFEMSGQVPPTRDKPLSMHVVHANYRRGAASQMRLPDMYLKFLCGGDKSKLHVLYDKRQSADLMFLAARLRAAEAKGELDRLRLPASLLSRRAEFEAMEREKPGDLKRFLEHVQTELRGKPIYLMGAWTVLYDFAQAGLAKGLEGVFSRDSVILTGGGAKNQVVPEDWEDQVRRFLGVERLNHAYGMSEIMANHKLCGENRYHIEPWTILFVLDPDTGVPFPRRGVRTGRAAFYDLLADTYWGGFVSGDEVSVDWSPCKCGRLSPHIARSIERYSDKRGGNDKISCAAAPEAHDSALRFLNTFSD